MRLSGERGGGRSGVGSRTVCRLCGGAVTFAFNNLLLGKYKVAYFRCLECQSLQTDSPFWLSEAYADAITSSDTGAVARCFSAFAAVHWIVRVLQPSGILYDFGGGPGLLCRLLRDRGYPAYMYDKYSAAAYAHGFVMPPSTARLEPRGISVLSAIEVFEHCSNPADELGELFDLKPAILIATTEIYREQGPDWWYLSGHSGQHLFFFSLAAMLFLARRYGYYYTPAGSYHIFSATKLNPYRRVVLKLGLSRGGLRLIRTSLMATQRSEYFERDSIDVVKANQIERN